jgi:hypothetical protein
MRMAHSGDSNKGTSCGATFLDIVTPATAGTVANPGARVDNDPTWQRKNQQYIESVTQQQKFS